MKIAVIGTGYVGLVTGTCFAEMGVTVTCVDIDEAKINRLKNGDIPIYEPGLSDMVLGNVNDGRLFFTASMASALPGIDALFIAVGTPPGEDGSADISHVLDVAQQVGQLMEDYFVVVTKSTVPIGSNFKVREVIRKEIALRGKDIPVDVASNPEFLKEGDAVNDFMHPDRIVVGTDSPRVRKTMERLYRNFILANVPILFMDIASAEMTKYAANSMLATRITFMNEIANLCEKVGADADEVRRGIGSDSRIGNKFLNAGCGYGGSCFPKDVKALIRTAAGAGCRSLVLEAVEEANERQKEVLFAKISRHFEGKLEGRKIAVWGLAFKPGTDDMREAPSIVLINRLLDAGVRVSVYDPEAMKTAERHFGDRITYASDMYGVLTEADALVVVTEWAEFKIPKFTYIDKALKHKVIFDGRNIYDPVQMRDFGYTYYGIGK